LGRTFRLIKYKKPYENTAEYPSVAQLDNATDSDSGEWGFKSLRVGQKIKNTLCGVFYFYIQRKQSGGLFLGRSVDDIIIENKPLYARQRVKE
jgi:hypothetical protein